MHVLMQLAGTSSSYCAAIRVQPNKLLHATCETHAREQWRYAIQVKSLLGVLTVLLPWNAVLACANLERDFGLMFPSEKSTIHGPMSVEQAERDRLVELQESGRVVPFGYLHERWEALKQRCAADPSKAKRVVMVSEDDCNAAIAAALAAYRQARDRADEGSGG